MDDHRPNLYSPPLARPQELTESNGLAIGAHPIADRQPALAPIDAVAGDQAPPRRGVRRGPASALAALAAVAAKFFAAIKALLIALPNLKLLATAGTALVSVAAYALFFGWPLAALFVALLFIHEIGHVIQLRREGLHASAPMFVPFLGAFIAARSLGEDAAAEARVGLAGPILGSLGAGAVALAGSLLHSPLLLAAAYLGFLINLFNLIPVTPLDGGRAVAAMWPWMWFAGFGILIALLITDSNPILLLIVIIAGFDLYRRWRERTRGGEAVRAYYAVSPGGRTLIGATYIALLVLLVLGMGATHVLFAEGHSFSSL
ncbi:MAG TPA: site-2 protease family protein [Solirubrobacteraceae bacterium]|nr:site-2 protease family protein [Solirubrobacteraceae bacterium]